MSKKETFFAKANSFKFADDSKSASGIIMPYGKRSDGFFMSYTFNRGAISYGEDILAFVQHDMNPSNVIGRVGNFQETEDGLRATVIFDEDYPYKGKLFSMIRNGNYGGFSVGVDEMEYHKDPDDERTSIVTSAVLKEVSIVDRPAFKDAKVDSLVASQEKIGVHQWRDMDDANREGLLKAVFSNKLAEDIFRSSKQLGKIELEKTKMSEQFQKELTRFNSEKSEWQEKEKYYCQILKKHDIII